MRNYDTIVLSVAQIARDCAQPEFAVLFGSRARGDHNALESDSDVLMVKPQDASSAALSRPASLTSPKLNGAAPVSFSSSASAGRTLKSTPGTNGHGRDGFVHHNTESVTMGY